MDPHQKSSQLPYLQREFKPKEAVLAYLRHRYSRAGKSQLSALRLREPLDLARKHILVRAFFIKNLLRFSLLHSKNC